MPGGNMFERSIHLDPQPGGIPPELHLKQGTRSMRLRLLVPPKGLITDYIYKPCVIKGRTPGGTDIFAISGCTYENRHICARIYEYTMQDMTAAPGRYRCTLSILNTKDTVNRDNYMDYDFLTVLPFTVIVEPRAKEG